MMLNIFSCACWPLVYLLLGNIYLGFLLGFFRFFFFKWVFLYLKSKFWIQVLLSEYFLPVGACNFIFLIVSVVKQKAKFFMKSNLLIFLFYDEYFLHPQQISLPTPKFLSVSPMK